MHLLGCCLQGLRRTLLFLPATEAAGFCPLCIVCVCLPQLCKSQLLLAPSELFTSCCPRRHWSKRKLSRRDKVPGPRSQVPASLSDMSTEVFAMIQNRLWAGLGHLWWRMIARAPSHVIGVLELSVPTSDLRVQSPVTSDVMLQE